MSGVFLRQFICGGVENREATEVRDERRSKRFETLELLRIPWREPTVRGDNDSLDQKSPRSATFVSPRSVASGV